MNSACAYCPVPADVESVTVEPLPVAAVDAEWGERVMPASFSVHSPSSVAVADERSADKATTASVDIDGIAMEETTASGFDVGALAVLLDVQAALASLRGQVAEQHRDLTKQLRAISGSDLPARSLGDADTLPQDSTHLIDCPIDCPPEFEHQALQKESSRMDKVTFLDAVDEAPLAEAIRELDIPAAREPDTSAGRGSSHSFTHLTNRMVSNVLNRNDTFKAGMASKHIERPSAKWRHVATDISEGNLRQAATGVINWDGFDRTVGVIIFINAVCIGVEIDLNTRNHFKGAVRDILQVSEVIFLVIYTMELIMRFYVHAQNAIQSGWVIFDLVIVLIGWAMQMLASAMLMTSELDLLQQLTLLRVLRLLRLVRAVRLIKQFKTLWRLVNGLLTSYDAIISTLVLILLALYLASCIGVELIHANDTLNSSNDTEVQYLVNHNFDTLQNTMLTLVRFVSADSVSSVYEPIIREQPWFSLYFMALLLVISISLLNLITAVLVEGALDKAKEDKETRNFSLRKKAKQYVPIARELFRCMDASGDGVLTLAEIRHCLADGHEQAEALCHQLNKIAPFDSVMELFESLDMNGDGEITEDEFVEGVLKTTLGDDNNLEITQVLRLIRVIARKVHGLEGLTIVRTSSSSR